MGYGNVSERRRQQPRIGVSVVILALGPAGGDGNDARAGLWMPLVRRIRQPYQGMWALPGGDVRADATLEASAYEALESTTDLHPRYLEQLYTFGGPGRSGMGLPMVSVVYWALVARDEAKSMTWDAERGDGDDNVRWFPEDRLPRLAFDHRAIIDYAIERLRTKIDYSDVATRLLGPTFTLRQLHDVHEAIAARPIDLANFRRKALAGGELEPTGDKRREGRQRPAALYRYRRATHDDGPAGPGGLWGEALERLDHGEGTGTEPPGDMDMPDEGLKALIPGAR